MTRADRASFPHPATLAGLSAAAALAFLAGCASTAPAPRASREAERREIGLPADARVTPAFEPLARLALSQTRHPVPVDGGAAPPGLPPELLAEAGSAAGESASLGLPGAIAAFGKRPDPPAPRAVSPEVREEALRRYIAGREKLLAGDAAGAIPDLRTAAERDPGAPEPQRELGEAYLAQGRRPDALDAMRRALDLGLEDPRILELLGRAALERQDYTTAASLLARAWNASPAKMDPLLPQVILIELSRALMQTGCLAAGREALFKSFDTPPALSASTRYLPEFNTFYRRQGELMREAGDASLRMGRYAQAVDDYARASAMPVLDGVSIAPRLVLATERAGRPALAALYILEAIAAKGGRAGEEEVALLGHLARLPGLGGPLASALDAYRAGLESAQGSPTLVRNLTRAHAAVMGGEGTREVLRAHLSRYPSDLEATLELLDTFATPQEVAREAVGLAARAPSGTPAIAEACLRARHWPAPDLIETRTEAGGLLHAALVAAQGRPAEALDALRDRPGAGPAAVATALARVQYAYAAGRPADAAPDLRRLDAATGPEGVRARASALALQQRPKQALATLEPLVSGPAPAGPAGAAQRIADLLVCAQLAAQVGRHADTEAWLTAAAALDPMDDRPRARLVEFYISRGDQARFNQTIRELRQAMPDSRAMRSLRASELAKRGLLDQAVQEAQRLAAEEVGDPDPMRLLVSIWQQQAKGDRAALERARDWLAPLLERRPQSPTLLAALTTLSLLENQPERADADLLGALAHGAGPDVSRMHEKLLRESLDQQARADRQAMERLEGRERSIAETIELAQVYARNRRGPEAVAILKAQLSDEITLSEEQAGQLAAAAALIGVQSSQAEDAAGMGASVWLFDQVASRSFRLTPDMHKVRLVVMASLPEVGADRLLRATGEAAAQFPDLAPVAAPRVVQVLLAANRGPTALRYIPLAIKQSTSSAPELWIAWVQAIGVAGGAADLRAFLDAADNANQLRGLLERFRGPGAPAAENPRAEVAFLFADLFRSRGRDPEADQAYELTLSIDPNHAWAANNLGYALADRGVELERASQLLEMAHARMPGEGSITDSLGWLRYKQGILEDQTDPATGRVSRQGAISLLKAAAETEHGKESPEVLDHLGDAYWLAGRSLEADRYWQLAENWATRAVKDNEARRRLSPQDGPAPEADALPKAVIKRVQEKRKALSAGEHVPVAPQVGNPAPAPATDHATTPAPSSPATSGSASAGGGATPQN